MKLIGVHLKMDPDLWAWVKEAARRHPQAAYQWVDEACREKLKRELEATEAQRQHKSDKESL